MGVSENRGPQYSTLNSRILVIRTPNKVPLIFGNSRIGVEGLGKLDQRLFATRAVLVGLVSNRYSGYRR